LIVARDIAHAKIKELLDGKPMPDYFKTIQFIMLVLQKRQECLQEVLDQLLPVVWMCTLRNSKTWRKHDYAC
jgi:hypothetical protein